MTFIAIQGLSVFPDIPAQSLSELWPPLWNWSQIIVRHLYCLASTVECQPTEVYATILSVIACFKSHKANNVVTRSIEGESGLRVLSGQAWSLLYFLHLCSPGAGYTRRPNWTRSAQRPLHYAPYSCERAAGTYTGCRGAGPRVFLLIATTLINPSLVPVDKVVEALDSVLGRHLRYHSVLSRLKNSFRDMATRVDREGSRTSPAWEPWTKFVHIVAARIHLLTEYESVNYEALRACDNAECGKIFHKSYLRRCSMCQNVCYCSVDCQAADWQRGHRARIFAHTGEPTLSHDHPRSFVFPLRSRPRQRENCAGATAPPPHVPQYVPG
ncbi:hypothetical protein C8R43DRAFT_1038381 [Mycena crocata]|nr:hypothetical protein C8R43DRAFT_1038381 [Mycena crocata]